MSNLVPRANSSLSNGQAPQGFSRNEGKALVRQQNDEVTRGLVAGTRVQAAGIGLQTTAMLSREANFQSDGDPHTAERLHHIVDRYAEFVGAEVNRFRF
jgi:hypothetical protein